MRYTRREFGTMTLATLPAAAALGPLRAFAQAPRPNSTVDGVRLGTITYSYRSMPDQSAEAILGYVLATGISEIEFMGGPVEAFAGAPQPPRGGGRRGQATPEQQTAQRDAANQLRAWRTSVSMDRFKALRTLFNDAGVTIFAWKQLDPSMSDAEMEYVFNVAEALGCTHTTLELVDNPDQLKRIGQFAEKKKIYAAYHTHLQGSMSAFDQAFAASPGNMANVDLGHFVAAGGDPVAFIKKFNGRISSVHLKDRTTPANGQRNVAWGTGDTPLKEILHTMRRERHTYPASIELEYAVPAGSDAVSETRKCFDYCKQALAAVVMAILMVAGSGPQAAAQGRGGRGGAPVPQFASPEVAADRTITFRIYAPQADAVRLAASDIPGSGQTAQLTRAENGVWQLTLGPVEPGSYRYNFNVDGVATIDPRNPAISESNNNVWSLVNVPGSDVFDTRDVPRGAVAEITYKSTALGRFRRMHVYTPPGYETNRERYPVFYLLHGAGDSDDSWSTVGRAGFILDNLIATRRAKPMIVVMPAGHATADTAGAIGQSATELFVNDFVSDVMPYVEKNYRVLTDRANTAIAGLSMGGNQTLELAIPRLQRFGYIGVFSSGLFGAFPVGGRGGAATPPPTSAVPPAAVEWEKQHAAKLDDAALKRGLRLLWFGTGKDDFLIQTTVSTVDLFKRHGFAPVFVESFGGHTWINWRNYLTEFAPQLFRN